MAVRRAPAEINERWLSLSTHTSSFSRVLRQKYVRVSSRLNSSFFVHRKLLCDS